MPALQQMAQCKLTASRRPHTSQSRASHIALLTEQVQSYCGGRVKGKGISFAARAAPASRCPQTQMSRRLCCSCPRSRRLQEAVRGGDRGERQIGRQGGHDGTSRRLRIEAGHAHPRAASHHPPTRVHVANVGAAGVAAAKVARAAVVVAHVVPPRVAHAAGQARAVGASVRFGKAEGVCARTLAASRPLH